MGARSEVLQVVSGWQAVELVFKCFFVGIWQLAQMSVKRLWKGHRRKAAKHPDVEVAVDSSVGTHCYIKVMGVKYHYVETGPKTGQKVLVLCDAPETAELWGPNWCYVVKQLADTDHHIVTLDLRGTGASEGGSRSDLSPPRAVEELALLMKALGVSEHNPATIIGFGIGGMLTWYLAHCHARLVRRVALVGAPHPDLYWQFPPAPFCKGALHFIQAWRGFSPGLVDMDKRRAAFRTVVATLQWPYFPERWLADSEPEPHDEPRWGSSRARDWVGALHYVRGAAWWGVAPGALVAAPALLVGGAGGAAELVGSAARCARPALRLVARAAPAPADPQLAAVLLDFLRPPAAAATATAAAEPPRGLVGRVLGAVAGRGRELSQRLTLPASA